MKRLDVTVSKKLELDQLATEIIKVANKYDSEIFVEKDGRKANAKSLLGVLSLGLAAGCSLTITATGEDEHEAVRCLEEMVVTQ